MRSRGLLRGTTLLTVAVMVALMAAAWPAAATDTPPTVLATTQLPLPSYADVAVDGTVGHVFVSGGRGTTDLVVTDLDGRLVGTIGNQQGATGLAVSADSTTVYAALGDGDAVSAIDTATLTERARYPLGAGTCPSDLVPAGGKLWFSYGCGQDGRIGSLDLRGPEPVVALDQGGAWYFPPRLASASADQGVLVAGRRETSPTTVTSFDVTSGQAVVRASTDALGGFLRDLEVTPDGTGVLVVTHEPDYPLVLSVADMSQVGYYDGSVGTTLVAVRPDGAVVTGTPAGILDAFAVGENRKVWTSYDGLAEPGLEVQGLAWAPNGGRVYTVSDDFSVGQPVLRVLVPPPLNTSIAAELLTWPVLVRQPMTIAGRLSIEDNTQPGVQTLHVTRQDRKGTVTLPDLKTAADGTFSLTDRPRTAGDTAYAFQFGGTDTLLPTQYAVTVPVAKH
jgi:DNA-binding beta-propeller fold protein YncE